MTNLIYKHKFGGRAVISEVRLILEKETTFKIKLLDVNTWAGKHEIEMSESDFHKEFKFHSTEHSLDKENDKGLVINGSNGSKFTISSGCITKIEGVIKQNNFLEDFVYMVMKELGYTLEEVIKGELHSNWAEEFSNKMVETLKRGRNLN